MQGGPAPRIQGEAEAAMLGFAGKPNHLSLAEIAARLAEAHGVLAETRSVCRWAGSEKRPGTLVQAAEAFTTLAGTLEFSVGVDAALAHLRALNAVQVERACTLGWAFRDAEAAEQAKQADLRLGTAKAAGYDGLLGELHEQVRRTRSTWTTCALAARAAADVARGAQEALDFFERGEPWRRRTGEKNGLFLLDLQDMLDARRRERKSEPA